MFMEFDINLATVILSFVSSVIGAIGAPFAAFHIWKRKIKIREDKRRAEIESAIDGLSLECLAILERFAREGDGLRLKKSDAVSTLKARNLITYAGGATREGQKVFLYIVNNLARDLIRERLAQSER